MTKSTRFSTNVVRIAYKPDETGAVIPPIHLSSTYIQTEPGKPKNFEYSRSGNPTRTILEKTLATLEHGEFGFAYPSGLAANTAVLNLFKPNSHIVAVGDIYGGTYRYFEDVLKPIYNFSVTYLAVENFTNLAEEIKDNTVAVWIETPTNPTLKLVDLAQAAATAKKHNVLTIVDNTFATPYIQKPLDLGCDIVVHSATKYLNGHSDVIAGAVVVKSEELAERLAYLQNATGSVLDPFNSFLILRGIRTLAIRVREHCTNALAIAQELEKHPAIQTVYYPGLASHAQHQIALKQMNNSYGGIVSVRFKETDPNKIQEFCSRLKYFTLAESLGGIESLICQPYSMTHAAIPEAEKLAMDITPSLFRISVGIEDKDDLIDDLLNALKVFS